MNTGCLNHLNAVLEFQVQWSSQIFLSLVLGGGGGLHSHLEEENQNHFEQGEHV